MVQLANLIDKYIGQYMPGINKVGNHANVLALRTLGYLDAILCELRSVEFEKTRRTMTIGPIPVGVPLDIDMVLAGDKYELKKIVCLVATNATAAGIRISNGTRTIYAKDFVGDMTDIGYEIEVGSGSKLIATTRTSQIDSLTLVFEQRDRPVPMRTTSVGMEDQLPYNSIVYPDPQQEMENTFRHTTPDVFDGRSVIGERVGDGLDGTAYQQ